MLGRTFRRRSFSTRSHSQARWPSHARAQFHGGCDGIDRVAAVALSARGCAAVDTDARANVQRARRAVCRARTRIARRIAPKRKRTQTHEECTAKHPKPKPNETQQNKPTPNKTRNLRNRSTPKQNKKNARAKKKKMRSAAREPKTKATMEVLRWLLWAKTAP
jgi:hypothetical protein